VKRSSTYLLLRTIILVAFLILSGRLWYMQIVNVNHYRALAITTKVRYRIVQALRGIIYDREGRPLVRNIPTFDITITPDQWPSNAAAAVTESQQLSHLLHGDPTPAAIRHLVWTGRFQITQPVVIKQDVPLQTVWSVLANREELPGVGATKSFTRQYLQGPLWPLSHIIGYVNAIDEPTYRLYADPKGPWAYQHYTMFDLVGQTGIERVYEHDLHGINGIEESVVNAAGDQIGPWKTVEQPIPGDGIRLTIDSHFEEQVAQDLQTALNHIGLRQGAAIVMNPWNGDILAIVSLPSFNNNIFSAPPGKWRNQQVAALNGDPLNPQFDFSVGGELAPGSIYKIITATAGLEDGVVTTSTIVDDTGHLQPCPICPTFHGWAPGGLGPVDIYKAIAESSDIYFYEVAGGGPDIPVGLGPWRLAKWAKLYGLGQPTGIELPGEAAGLVPDPKTFWHMHHSRWFVGDSYNIGIGQGDDLVTPLQMVRMVSVIANGGNLVRPRIVAAILHPNSQRPLPGHNFDLVPDYVRQHFVSPQVVSIIRQGMRWGVDQSWGTSYGQIDPRLNAAGKTGTAETAVLNKPNAWWVGFAPYDHPKIAVCVVIPRANGEGAFVAAPIASKIMDDYFGYHTDPSWVNKVQPILLGTGR
jgi:penicillin-binding protein 2